jgi:predicted hotdog family 3-hydroxylacyl-ACP dehydratase
MQLNRAWIAARIPHQGRMCLLDEVIEWDDEHLRCRATSHRALDNPLRAHGRLGIACGIEYAGQAMALHGAAAHRAAGAPQLGFLAAVRDMRPFVLRLDDIESDLICEVTHLMGDARTSQYEFVLSALQKTLLSGRATVVLDAGRRMTL